MKFFSPISEEEFSQKTFQLFLQNKNEYFLKSSFILGVSGGPDSMALSYLFSQLSRVKNNKVLAVIVDHNLRETSSFEASTTKRRLKKIGINSKIIKLNRYIKKTGIQEWARTERFKIFFNLALSKNSILVLAHNYEDQIETLLMRMYKNTGFLGAGGIKNYNLWNKIKIIRPLLDFPKQRLIDTCKKNKIEYFNDPSNLNVKFERVRIRNSLKYFSKINFDTFNLFKMGNAIKTISRIVESKFFEVSKKKVIIHPLGWCKIEPEWFFISQEKILKSVISRRLSQIGGEVNPPSRIKINNLIEHIKKYKNQLENLPARTISGCKIKFWKNKIVILRFPRKKIKNQVISKWGSLIFDNRWIIKGSRGLEFNYLAKQDSATLRKRIDKNKHLPWEIWNSIPVCLNVKNSQSYYLNLEENKINNHLEYIDDLRFRIDYNKDLKISFIF